MRAVQALRIANWTPCLSILAILLSCHPRSPNTRISHTSQNSAQPPKTCFMLCPRLALPAHASHVLQPGPSADPGSSPSQPLRLIFSVFLAFPAHCYYAFSLCTDSETRLTNPQTPLIEATATPSCPLAPHITPPSHLIIHSFKSLTSAGLFGLLPAAYLLQAYHHQTSLDYLFYSYSY